MNAVVCQYGTALPPGWQPYASHAWHSAFLNPQPPLPPLTLAPPTVDYNAMLSKMSEATVKGILGTLARTNRQVAEAVIRACQDASAGPPAENEDKGDNHKEYNDYDDEEEEEDDGEDYDDYSDEDGEFAEDADKQQSEASTPAPLNFDPYSKAAWQRINRCYDVKLTKQDELAVSAFCDVMDMVDLIGRKTPKNSPYQTKKSALETIRKTCKSLLLTGECVGKQIRLDFAHDATVPEVMMEILQDMTPEERVQVGTSADHKGTLLSKVEWVKKEAESYAMDPLHTSLEEVVKLMSP